MASHWRAPAGQHAGSARLPDEGELPSLDGVAGRPPGGPARSATWWTAYLFLETSPDITGEILHVDGGQVAGH